MLLGFAPAPKERGSQRRRSQARMILSIQHFVGREPCLRN
jgi:hypothetical protein